MKKYTKLGLGYLLPDFLAVPSIMRDVLIAFIMTMLKIVIRITNLSSFLVVTIHEENHDCPGHLDSELFVL